MLGSRVVLRIRSCSLQLARHRKCVKSELLNSQTLPRKPVLSSLTTMVMPTLLVAVEKAAKSLLGAADVGAAHSELQEAITRAIESGVHGPFVPKAVLSLLLV